MLKKALIAAGMYASLAAPNVMADWVLDSQASSLHFISIKKSSVAETHHFTNLSGTLTDKGQFTVGIQLTSVETAIPIRNERMQEHLFEVAKFPVANVTAEVDMATLANLKAGSTISQTLPFTLKLHGQSKVLNTTVTITQLTGGKLQVTTAQPILVNAADFGLLAGIEKLRELAGLNVIATSVPVTFSLSLTPQS